MQARAVCAVVTDERDTEMTSYLPALPAVIHMGFWYLESVAFPRSTSVQKMFLRKVRYSRGGVVGHPASALLSPPLTQHRA